MYKHWFVSRQKRQLTTILSALVAFSDVCVGKQWAGNIELQLAFEDELGKRNITEHGSLRARKTGQGGGGTRTLFKQMKDLGLIFTETENNKCRLTLLGEELIKGSISFVSAMRLQLKRYQYPSASSWSGSGSIEHHFHVHPFQFMLRLLRDTRLDNSLTMEEMYGIVIHHAYSDSNEVFNNVVKRILKYRDEDKTDFISDTPTKSYSNIANTFFNYLSLTQFIDRGFKSISIRSGKESEVDDFIEASPTFIKHPELMENYQRKYGRGTSSKDLRNFACDKSVSKKELQEARIRKEYVLLALRTPVIGITPDIVQIISENTGIDERAVEKFLIANYKNGNISDFFAAYRELAYMGRAGAVDFEKATCEIFHKIFGMRAEHTGPVGNTPDVFVESSEYKFCGIIDNKAYKNGYSITGDHKRVMKDVYIPNYKKYGKTEIPLAFFAYIAGSFGKNINSQLDEIHRETGINGSAVPVYIFINIAQDYAEKELNHDFLKKIFSLNREVILSDIQ